ncbi:MAG: hypothetical protein ABUS48_03250 [Pseudomonadota bacterium]
MPEQRPSPTARPNPARRALFILTAAVLAGAATPAFAGHILAPPTAPLWQQIALYAVLWTHIGGGGFGILAGTVALFTRKGEKLHRAAGNVFFIAMLAMAGVGAIVAPLLHDRVSSVAGVMTLYLVTSGWVTVKRRENSLSAWEIGGLFWALAFAIAGYIFISMAMRDPSGTVDGQPPQALYVFATIGTLAALCDLKIVFRRGIAGPQRIARHAWRMSLALLVATGSFFLGQQQVMPVFIQGSPWLILAALYPLPLLIFWVFYVRLSKRFRDEAPAPAVA